MPSLKILKIPPSLPLSKGGVNISPFYKGGNRGIAQKINRFQSINVGEPLCGLLNKAATEGRPYGR
jgi:hypothetical protein